MAGHFTSTPEKKEPVPGNSGSYDGRQQNTPAPLGKQEGLAKNHD
jgi:hypothetical protein